MSPKSAYIISFLLLAIATVLAAAIRVPASEKDTGDKEKPSFETLVAGFRYIGREKIILGAISSDLFAMLLGGASALLPVYARDILAAGPWGLFFALHLASARSWWPPFCCAIPSKTMPA